MLKGNRQGRKKPMNSQTMIQGLTIPEEFLGRLTNHDGDPTDTPALSKALESDGYVLLRGALDVDEVISARAEVFSSLESVGEITLPAVDGTATGMSLRQESVDNLGVFWQQFSEGRALRQVTHGLRINRLLASILGEPARGHDLMYVRPAPVGRATRMHYDFPFFAGGGHQIVTAWVPLGDAPVADGPLVVVEGSNRFDDLIVNVEYDGDCSNEVLQQAAYSKQNDTDPVALVLQRGTRLLTTDFVAGDLMVFSMFLMHGSLDNCSTESRVRLSCDVRYQPAAASIDDTRYFGPNPSGSKGGGYGDMRGAQPLTEPW